jgi:tetratricopeptide (TPR) repeat protein
MAAGNFIHMAKPPTFGVQMKSLRKPLFWGFVLLLGVITCVGSLAVVYLNSGDPLGFFSNGQQAYSQPVDEKYAVQATVSALKMLQNDYYQKQDINNVLKVTDKMLEMDPENPVWYDEVAFMIHDLSQSRTSMSEFQKLTELGLKYADKGISLDPNNGNLYRERANLLLDLQDISIYRVDHEYLNKFWVENILAEISFGSSRVHPERLIVFAKTSTGDCEGALAETERLAAVQGLDDSSTTRNIETLYESAYSCLGDYQKALEHHQKFLEKTNQTEMESGDVVTTSSYYYNLRQPDKALELLNQSIEKNPHFGGNRYFIRAVIEFDQGKFDEALNDAQMAEGNSWSNGMFQSYIEGLIAEHNGDTEMAIKYLQYAEATFSSDWLFAINRSREELKKLGADTLKITPSVRYSATPMQVYPTLDLESVRTVTPDAVTEELPVPVIPKSTESLPAPIKINSVTSSSAFISTPTPTPPATLTSTKK